MPRGKKTTPQNFNSVEFIRFELSSEDKKDLVKWVEKNKDREDDLLTEVVQANHKVNVSYNGQNDSFIVSVTGKPEDCDNANKCFTSHGKTWKMALWVALYKYHVVWQRGVWESVDSSEDFG